MRTFDQIATLREYLDGCRAAGKTISFVPTMGALHQGHRACLDLAVREGQVAVASIYVNPTQFSPGEDFERYPRLPEEDLSICEQAGCRAVFLPSDGEMYAEPQSAWVSVDALTEPMCGRTRAGHFRGVATVVAKLFNIVGPDVAVFGQKDAQQALVIRRMVRQLGFPVRLALAPIVREEDGLAVSSRNRYLSPGHRRQAPGLYQALLQGRSTIEAGEREPEKVNRAVRRELNKRGIAGVEYVETLGAADLSVADPLAGKVIIALAARLGSTRLIDNLVLDIAGDGGVAEAMLF